MLSQDLLILQITIDIESIQKFSEIIICDRNRLLLPLSEPMNRFYGEKTNYN